MPLYPATPYLVGSGFPKSGTAGTGVGKATGSVYIDGNTGVQFTNEGTAASPYWTPTNTRHPRLYYIGTDFKEGAALAGEPVANTNGAQDRSNGIRYIGQGLAETDSGGPATYTLTDGGFGLITLTTTDEDAHTVALVPADNTNAPMWQPDQHGTMVVDALISSGAAITAKAVFVGFTGTAPNALDPIMTFATTTVTNVATDLVGLVWSSELTLNDDWLSLFFDETGGGTKAAASYDTGIDTAITVYQRLRVEVDTDGTARTFINKALVGTHAAASVDPDEEFVPMVYLESSSAAVATLLVRHYYAWGAKPALHS